jgi:hypothetical protein
LELANLSIEILIFLFLIAVTAGLLDTLAGGGGLLTTPALIVSGIPPLTALGTNKLQGSMGTATAAYMMIKNKKVRWNDVRYLMLYAFIGSIFGTISIQYVNTDILSFVIPLVLIFIATYFLISPKPKKDKKITKSSVNNYKNIIIPTIGFYDGMFGPGTGSFFALSTVSFKGHDIIKSTAIAKPLNFSTNIASLFIFLAAGKIVWVSGITMIFGQVIGAWIGSLCLFKINTAYLRVIIVLMSTAMLIKYADSMGWFIELSEMLK